MTSKFDAVVVFSGGMDSATLLWEHLSYGRNVCAISVDYGQRHGRELDYAERFIARCKERFPGQVHGHHVIDLSAALRGVFGENSQTNPDVDVPVGRYDADNMKLTVVPNRNMILMSVCGAYALAHGASTLAYGAHAGDHTIYPDCRPEFVHVMEQAFTLCDWNGVELRVPYLHYTKGDICSIGKKLEVPYELTWTCYKGEVTPCGVCGSCTERAEAFEFAGIPDPLLK